MEYYSNFIWEAGRKEDMCVSLVLQHAQVCKKPVLLACVCDSHNAGEIGITESGHFTEGLVEWFHRSFLKLCEKNMTDAEVERLLQKEIGGLQQEVGRFALKKGVSGKLQYWGILLWENRCWIFTKGDCEGYLLNRRFQRKHMRKLYSVEKAAKGEKEKGKEILKNEAAKHILSGRLQRNLGILLCTCGFMSKINMEEASEVLVLDGTPTEERLEKRLRELWQENKSRGENGSVGAIYLHT